MPRTPSRRIIYLIGARLVAALMIMAALAGTAAAHASLNSTSPADGAVIEFAPAIYSLTFSEPVAPLSLRIVRPDGSNVPLNKFALRGNVVEISPPSELDRGTHVLSWRVVSADGHPIGGSVVFSIGEPSTVAPVVQETVDWTVRGLLWLSKVALYVGLFIGVGGVFAIRVLMPELFRGGPLFVAAIAIGILGAIVSVGLQGLDALEAPLPRFFDAIVWSTGLGTSYGSTVASALVAFAFGVLGLGIRGLSGGILAVAGLLAAGTSLAISGHASAASPQWLMRPTVFAHVATVAAWIGALVPLGLALHAKDSVAVPALKRFSSAIPAFVALLVLAGAILTVVQVGNPKAVFDTAYGQVFLVKLTLLAGLFARVAANRWVLTKPTESGDPSATRRLVRSIVVETLIALAIFGAVAAWRFTPPPRALAAAAAAPATTHIHTEKAMADLTVIPGRTGKVSVTAMLMTGDFGALDAKDVTFVFSNAKAGIEPFKRKAAKPGDGTWLAENVVLPLPGEWTVRVDILITDFEMARIEGKIQIRP